MQNALWPRRAQMQMSATDVYEVLVVIPCLNEEAHIDRLLKRLRADPGARRARIVVADGGSTDRSVEIVHEHAKRDPRVVFVRNDKRYQSAAVNRAFALYGAAADIIIRIDAHATYPADYCQRLQYAQIETGADSVVVSMIAKPDSGKWFQVAAAAAQNSRLGTGGAGHRHTRDRRWTDHGHHALMDANIFGAAGGYDETFSHNEDAELDVRICRAGGKILLASDIAMIYHPRKTARALFRQYFNFGRGRARTLRRHGGGMRPRQLVALGVAPVALSILAAPLFPLAAAPALSWLGLCLAWGATLGPRENNATACFAGIPAAISQFAWSSGYLFELARTPFIKDARPQQRFAGA